MVDKKRSKVVWALFPIEILEAVAVISVPPKYILTSIFYLTSPCTWGLNFDTSNLCYLGVSNKLCFGIACDVKSKFQACCVSSHRVIHFCNSLSELTTLFFFTKHLKT